MTGTAFAEFDRASGIGASEVPAITGVSPWAAPVNVWLDKVGLAGPRPQTASQATGLALEGAVLGIAADTLDLRLVRNRMTFTHPRWPEVPLYATPDGFARAREGLVEVKVVGWRGADWAAGPPEHVVVQVQAQMAVHRRARWTIVAALLGSEVRTWEVERDPAMVEAIESDVVDFWTTHVQGELAPEAVTPAERWAVARALSGRTAARVERVADEEEELTAARLTALRVLAQDVEKEQDELRLALAERAAASTLVGNGWTGSWTERRTVEWQAMAKDLGAVPRVVEEYTTRSRVFTFRRTRAEEMTA